MRHLLKSRTPRRAATYRPSTEAERTAAVARRNVHGLIRWMGDHTRHQLERECQRADRQRTLNESYVQRRIDSPLTVRMRTTPCCTATARCAANTTPARASNS